MLFMPKPGGGPGTSTQVITLNIYEEAFSNNFRFGVCKRQSNDSIYGCFAHNAYTNIG